MFRGLDTLTNTKVFSELYGRYVHNGGFPDLSSTMQELGINTRRNRVSLSDDAPQASVRSAIMKG